MKCVIILLPFVYLWYRVFDCVQSEWSTNPQYSYGWIVPILCLGLIVRNWNSISADRQEPISASAAPISCISWALLGFLLLLFLPVRLIAATTPEWRPLQWATALIAVGATLFLVRSVWGRPGITAFAFPICFILVAIPWPTPIEQPIIQSLTSANASVVVELMGILGIPAIQHGNVIEVSSGVVGIDEACSGIRSFQSSLMISLFLGEFYALKWPRRLALLASGAALSFAFNICRTSFLTWIAEKKGIAAIAHYHDPAGLAILVACTVTLWLVGLYLSRNHVTPKTSANHQQTANPCRTQSIIYCPLSINRLLPLGIALTVGLATIEIGTQCWFSIRESKLVAGPSWTLAFPVNDTTFKSNAIGEKTTNLLRYDEGKEGQWNTSDGARWHAFYFNWLPGRVAGYLAKRHTPEICMGASGQSLKSGPNLFVAKINKIELPIRQYLYDYQGRQIHVFHCRWESGASQNTAVVYESDRLNLIRGIWAGRGKQGQKVLEFIVTGYDTPGKARAALLQQLEALVQIDPNKKNFPK